MKKNILSLCALSLLFVIAGCGKTTTAKSEKPGEADYRIDGMAPKDFYLNLKYRSQEDGPNKRYLYLMNDDERVLSKDTRNRMVTGELTLFLLPEEYTVIYREQLVCNQGSKTRKLQTAFRVTSGKWQVEESQILLEEFAMGQGFKHKKGPAINMRLKNSVGWAPRMLQISSTTSMDEALKLGQVMSIGEAHRILDEEHLCQ